MGVGDEIAAQLTQNFRREDEQQDDDLQGGGQLNAEVLLDENGSMNSTSTSRQINALSYSCRMMEDTRVPITIRRSTRYTANTAG